MQNLTVQKVCLALISLVVFIAAPWITSETLAGNTTPMLALGGIAVVLLFVYGLGDRCWWLIPFCLPVEGNLNFLPLNFSIQETAILVVFCYLLYRMIFGMDVGWKLGPALLWVPLLGILSIIIYHWIQSGDVGIKLLGGSGWGGRKYFKVLLAAFCIPLLASFPGMRWNDLQKVPLLYFFGAFVDIVPDTLTTLIPATAPFVWRFYSGVNLGEFGSTMMGNFSGEVAITRIGTLNRLGTAIGLVTLCYFPVFTWLSPNRLWALPTLLLGMILCAASGFRNTVVKYILSVLGGLYTSLRWRAFLILPVGLAAALGVAFTQGKVFDYPLAMQRGLSFLPGDWDPKAVREATSSSEWRDKMKELFYAEYFPKHPVLGVGYHFDPELAKVETDVYLAIAQRQMDIGDKYADVRRYIEMRQPHEGPLHILLVAGSLGGAFFVAFCFCLLLYAFGSVSRTRPKEIAPLQVWAVALLLPQIFGFFFLFGDLPMFLLQVCPIAALLYRCERLKEMQQLQPKKLSADEVDALAVESPTWQEPVGAWHPRQAGDS